MDLFTYCHVYFIFHRFFHMPSPQSRVIFSLKNEKKVRHVYDMVITVTFKNMVLHCQIRLRLQRHQSANYYE